MLTPVLAFMVTNLFEFLIWAAAAGVAFLAWQKAKGGWMLVMVGAAADALFWFLAMVNAFTDFEAFIWLIFLANALVVAGIYLVAKPLIAERLAALKSQIATPPSPPK